MTESETKTYESLLMSVQNAGTDLDITTALNAVERFIGIMGRKYGLKEPEKVTETLKGRGIETPIMGD